MEFCYAWPHKGNYANECEFIKIEKLSLIVWKRFSKPIFQGVATFEKAAANGTKIVFRQIFNSVKECNKVKAFAADKNKENFDRPEAELAKMIL
jgi:hypothetical protein